MVVNNILDASEGNPFSMEQPWGREYHNLIRSRGDAVPSALGPHDVIAADPGSVDSRGGDLRLRVGRAGRSMPSSRGRRVLSAISTATTDGHILIGVC